MKTHVTVLGWLQILLGALDLFMALVVFGILAGMGVALGLTGEGLSALLAGALGTVIGFVMLLTGVPNLLAGFGLLAGKNWARILTLVLAVFNILKFPWGTALALYTFWVLTRDEAKEILRE